MSFLDKAKAAAEQAAAKAKEEYDELQVRRALGQAYNELGTTSFELIESGELAHERLEGPAARIRALRERSASDEAPDEPEPEQEPSEPEPLVPPESPT
jgi:hypothetical protein